MLGFSHNVACAKSLGIAFSAQTEIEMIIDNSKVQVHGIVLF